MAFQINETREWAAGAGSAPKYSVTFALTCTMTAKTDTEAKFNLSGTITAVNHPNGSPNSWPASDFAVLTIGGFDPADYPFTNGTSYYQQALPALPNAPQSYIDALRVEFRGDTYRSAGANHVSIWTADGGLKVNASAADATFKVNVYQNFAVTLNGSASQPVLIYTHSGANSSTDYNWLSHEVWAITSDFGPNPEPLPPSKYDYRPGATNNGSSWQSHNRNGGRAQIYTGSVWNDMYTHYDGAEGVLGTDQRPYIQHNNGAYNMRNIGAGQWPDPPGNPYEEDEE